MFIEVKKGIVTKVNKQRTGITFLTVDIEGKEERAINYDYLSGKVEVGDEVILNTTAVSLGLGSGGYHFVLSNKDFICNDNLGKGHIMKLNYTPLQIKVCSIEEESAGYTSKFDNFTSLNGLPVLIGSLHSVITPVVATLSFLSNDKLNTCYIMTDASCLPMYLSESVNELKKKGLIKHTVTSGHAFGGDFEAINIYSALIFCKEVIKSDIVIVAMGIGSIGTGTRYGFCGIEQGEIINAVNIFGGKAILIPRISFSDKRERHYGISHHTLTILSKIALSKAFLPIPILPDDKSQIIKDKLRESGVFEKHDVIEVDGEVVFEALAKYGLEPTVMGRNINEDKEYFLSCGASAKYAYLACVGL